MFCMVFASLILKRQSGRPWTRTRAWIFFHASGSNQNLPRSTAWKRTKLDPGSSDGKQSRGITHALGGGGGGGGVLMTVPHQVIKMDYITSGTSGSYWIQHYQLSLVRPGSTKRPDKIHMLLMLFETTKYSIKSRRTLDSWGHSTWRNGLFYGDFILSPEGWGFWGAWWNQRTFFLLWAWFGLMANGACDLFPLLVS